MNFLKIVVKPAIIFHLLTNKFIFKTQFCFLCDIYISLNFYKASLSMSDGTVVNFIQVGMRIKVASSLLSN